MADVFTEARHAGEFLISEAEGTRSRDVITVANSVALEAGTVLGKVTASGKYKLHDPSKSDGTENAAGILLAAVDASGGDASGVAILRDAEVDTGALTFIDAISGANKTAALAALAGLGIIAR